MHACTLMLVAFMARCRSTHCSAHEQQDIAGIHHRLDHAAVPAEIMRVLIKVGHGHLVAPCATAVLTHTHETHETHETRETHVRIRLLHTWRDHRQADRSRC
jgi:hypothetical protein